MTIGAENSWSYYLVKEAQKSAYIDSPMYGLCAGHLSLKIHSLIGADSKIELADALDSAEKVSSVKVISSSKKGGGVLEIRLDLLDLPAAIGIFDLCLVDEFNTSVKIASLVLLPITQGIQPVSFIIGSPRSGTTAVGNLVQLAYDTKNHGEAHVAQAFQELIAHSNTFFNDSSAALNKGTLAQEVPALYVEAQLVLNLRDLYQRFYPDQAIIDKTPGIKMIECLPLLFKVFPNAKVIYCQRRGMENIASRMRKFDKVPFEGHCKQWKRSITLWQKMKNIVSRELGNSDWCIQIEQFELAKSPEKVIKDLLVFLDISLSKQKKLLRYLETSSPQKTTEGPELALSLHSINWTQQQKDLFLLHCESLMQANNYSLDERYYLSK